MTLRCCTARKLRQALSLALVPAVLVLGTGCRSWSKPTKPELRPAAPANDTTAEIRRHADDSAQAAASVTFPATR